MKTTTTVIRTETTGRSYPNFHTSQKFEWLSDGRRIYRSRRAYRDSRVQIEVIEHHATALTRPDTFNDSFDRLEAIGGATYRPDGTASRAWGVMSRHAQPVEHAPAQPPVGVDRTELDRATSDFATRHGWYAKGITYKRHDWVLRNAAGTDPSHEKAICLLSYNVSVYLDALGDHERDADEDAMCDGPMPYAACAERFAMLIDRVTADGGNAKLIAGLTELKEHFCPTA